jgi:DNA (cytosine-5)-methyltransferase 1
MNLVNNSLDARCDVAETRTVTYRPTAIELFAGVGGFHVALHGAGIDVVWANQWEPSTKTQHAAQCLVTNIDRGRLPPHDVVPYDIEHVLDEALIDRIRYIPKVDLVVGGFPCQDYSVAKPLSQAAGIAGKKGVLWWQIHRLLEFRRPPFFFLENVDRLLKSPSTHRGRDFAIMLASVSDLGYSLEWRVVNAADYGFPQKRRRVYIVGRLGRLGDPLATLTRDGTLARALPVEALPPSLDLDGGFKIDGALHEISESFGSRKPTPFLSGGVMSERRVTTRSLRPDYEGERQTLGDILQHELDVPPDYFIPETQIESWRYLKGAKAEPRVHKGTGLQYFYQEGAIPFPDRIDQPSRTILTGEGGSSASRFKHIIQTPSGRYRRLTPVELERLNGFPPDWTATGMPDGRRAFMMGNALVVGVVKRIALELAHDMGALDQSPAADSQEVAAIA